MVSCATLEQAGRWRWVGVMTIFACALVPAVPLLWVAAEGGGGGGAWLGEGFPGGLRRSLQVAVWVAGLSLVAGLPCGVLAGLYRFPFRRVLLALLVLPLLAPPFLWALGLSMLRTQLALPPHSLLGGLGGTVLAFCSGAVPLTLFASMLASQTLSRSQTQAARLAGGEMHLCLLAARHAFPMAALAATLGAVLTISDPGPGQIFGHEGAASQILISFAASYDFSLAARQSLALAGLALAVALPVAGWLAPRLSAGLLARSAFLAEPGASRAAGRLTLVLVCSVIGVTILPGLAGLCLPAFRDAPFERAWQEAARTLPNTVLYGVGAGLLAMVLGVALALCAGRQPRLRLVALAGVFVLFSLPPALGALGIVRLGSEAGAAFDPVLRGRFPVVLWLGLRLFPIVSVFAMRRLGAAPVSWAQAAALHGLPLRIYFLRILAPWLLPAAAVGGLLAGLLGIADIGSMLLLHPPGHGSFPLAIFTVMANAPESLVATLCLAYFGLSALVLALAWALAGRISSFPARS